MHPRTVDRWVRRGRLFGIERRDLANALLRGAWSAVLEETRLLLLDLLLEVDDATGTGVR
jgi:hypothetical protein